MAKVIVRVKRPLQLGMGPNAPKLKTGKNEIDESLIDRGVWYVKALLASGAIVIESAPEPPAPETLAEVVISKDKIEVIPPSIQPDKPPESVVETVKTEEPVKVMMLPKEPVPETVKTEESVKVVPRKPFPPKKKTVVPKIEKKPKIKREI